MTNKKKLYFSSRLFAFLLCLIPLVGVIAPRAMAFLPALAALLGVFAVYKEQNKFPSLNRAALGWMSALIALVAVGSLWALDPSLVWERVLKLAPIFLGGVLLISVARVAPRQAVEDFQKFFPFAVSLTGLVCILDLSMHGFIYPIFHDVSVKLSEVSYSFLNRGIIIYCLSVVAVLFMGVPPKLKYLSALLLILVLMWTESQSVQLAMLMALVVVFFPAQSKALYLFLGGVTIVFFLAAPFIAQWLFQDLASVLNQYDWFKMGYAANRTEIWDFVARRALERPFFGHGIEATRIIEDFDVAGIYNQNQTVLHPHNFALQVWIEFGLMGVLFFCSFLGFIYVKIWRLSKDFSNSARFSLTVFMACLCMAAISYGLWQGWWIGLFSFMLGLSFLMIRVEGFNKSSE